MIDDVESKEGRCRCPLYNMVVCGTYLLESTSARYGIQFSERQGTCAWFPKGMQCVNLLAIRVTCSLFYASSQSE